MGVYRVITFNIAHGRGLSLYQGFHSAKYIERNLAKITSVLTEADVDFVAFQEVDQDSYWNKNIDLIKVIQRETPYHHSFIGLNNERGGKRNLNYGNAILSRHPMQAEYNQPFDDKTFGGKGFMYAEITLGGAQLPVINVHLDFRSRQRRVEQIDQLIDFLEGRLDDINALPIICGDFNCPAKKTGDAVFHLFRYLEDHGYRVLPDKNALRTFPAHFPTRTIDFIFMPPRCTIREVSVLPVYVSDHRPVLVEFESSEDD